MVQGIVTFEGAVVGGVVREGGQERVMHFDELVTAALHWARERARDAAAIVMPQEDES
jgi:hypothetical protein